MRTLTGAISLALAVSAGAAVGLTGQTIPGDSPSAFCWRGHPSPACRGFALFELEVGLVVASTTTIHESPEVTYEYPAFENQLNWHLGAMRNLSEEWALGATVSLGTGSPSPLTGIRVRARRWFQPPMSAESARAPSTPASTTGSGRDSGGVPPSEPG